MIEQSRSYVRAGETPADFEGCACRRSDHVNRGAIQSKAVLATADFRLCLVVTLVRR